MGVCVCVSEQWRMVTSGVGVDISMHGRDRRPGDIQLATEFVTE